MSRHFLKVILILSVFFMGYEALAKKRKRTPKWSASVTNGYTFYSDKKFNVDSETVSDWNHFEGQMNTYFSSLDISRNFDRYELGAKIQFMGSTFVSPFFKWNIVKQSKKIRIKPSITLGVVPHSLFGAYLRFNFGINLNRYVTLNPFVGVHGWYKLDDDPKYEKHNYHANAGFSLSLYY